MTQRLFKQIPILFNSHSSVYPLEWKFGWKFYNWILRKFVNKCPPFHFANLDHKKYLAFFRMTNIVLNSFE